MSAPSVLYRRDLLTGSSNPRSDRDYLVGFESRLERVSAAATGQQNFTLHISYVPDRLILPSHLAGDYFAHLAQDAWSGPEDLAHMLVDDLNNELVPRWLAVTVTTMVGGLLHHARVEDRQPNWENVPLLAHATGHSSGGWPGSARGAVDATYTG